MGNPSYHMEGREHETRDHACIHNYMICDMYLLDSCSLRQIYAATVRYNYNLIDSSSKTCCTGSRSQM